MSKPTIAVFIDGSNFYHAAKEELGHPMGVPGFKSLLEQIGERFQISSVRFYDAVKDQAKDPDGYVRQQKFHATLKSLWPSIQLRMRKLKYLAFLTEEKAQEAGKAVGIVDACKAKLWSFLRKLKLVRLTKEKGIDILLVVDAVELARTKQVNWVCIISGDADFTPAVQLINSIGIKTLNLHTYSGSSTELRQACSDHALIEFDEKDQPTIKWYG